MMLALTYFQNFHINCFIDLDLVLKDFSLGDDLLYMTHTWPYAPWIFSSFPLIAKVQIHPQTLVCIEYDYQLLQLNNLISLINNIIGCQMGLSRVVGRNNWDPPYPCSLPLS